MEIIFKKLLNELNDSSNNINNYFRFFNIYNDSFYSKLNSLSNNSIFIYIIIGFFIFVFFNFFKLETKHLIALIISVMVIIYLFQKDYLDFTNYIKDNSNKIKFLNKLLFNDTNWNYADIQGDFLSLNKPYQKSYLYLNPLIVDFFYNIREFTQYNINSYTECLKNVNNIIGLNQQVSRKLYNPYLDYTTAILFRENALNALSSIIYNIPSTIILDNKLYDSVNNLQELLNAHILDIGAICKYKNEKEGIDNYSMPDDIISDKDYIKGNDIKSVGYNSSYNMY